MPGPNPHRNTDAQEDRFDDQSNELNFLGVTTRGYEMYYDDEDHVHGTAEPDAQGPIRLQDRTPLGDNTSLGEFISDIEDQIGWEELSPFAESHRATQGDEATDDDADEESADREA